MAELIPYPAIEELGVIGDRRTAALVGPDGTLQWLCLPDYDGVPVFGALLDSMHGGLWRIGPASLLRGRQSYRDDTATLVTHWATTDYELQLEDCMARPGDQRDPAEDEARIVIRHLRCIRGDVDCVSIRRLSIDFTPIETRVSGILPNVGTYTLWSSDSPSPPVAATMRLRAGDERWEVFEYGGQSEWTPWLAARLKTETEHHWKTQVSRFWSELDPRLVRSAITIRLLEYAPCGSVVAAPTTSLPERVGGSWNCDYRLTWVRDASLSMWTLARLGDIESAKRYLGWLIRATSLEGAPLQVLYRIRGGVNADQSDRSDIEGYRGSTPVRSGNHAYRQQQMDIFGYVADCAREYLHRGGEHDPQLWTLLRRAADYVMAHWRDGGNGIWEVPLTQHYLSSLVMCWVTLGRVAEIGARFGHDPRGCERWKAEAETIRRSILEQGWSARLGAFQQSLEHDILDASALLIVITGLLPPDDERVVATVNRIAERLTIDGCVYRFDPLEMKGFGDASMGQFEAAFLPCTFWLATAYALMGRRADAEDIIGRAERAAGPLGLFAEAIDPRANQLAGNTPLLFSHVEYVRAVSALQEQEAPRGARAHDAFSGRTA